MSPHFGKFPPQYWVQVGSSSSNVEAIRWTPDWTLWCRFKKGTRRHYGYHPVDPDWFWDMLSAPSKGKYVHAVLIPMGFVQKY